MSDSVERTDLDAINSIEKLSVESLGAGMIGNVLEWYDFGLYGYLAPMIGEHFFPSHNPVASLIGAYGGFPLGLFLRPLRRARGGPPRRPPRPARGGCPAGAPAGGGRR